uniref:NB-ARC domain-containing protein n=1 Tax=Fagus sylvatica TaxID=28930 RepID=A0A2N9ESF6_FAGSY
MWLDIVTGVLVSILSEIAESMLEPILRHIGKQATQKTTTAVKLLQDARDFKQLTHRAPTPGIEIFSSSGDCEVFESRKLIFEELMEALRDDNCKRIGLHGLGADIRKIQGEIADCLNLKLDEESDSGRVKRICLRIKQAKKILIILDDAWKDVDFEAIGIPSIEDQEGCKILLTTRSEHKVVEECKGLPIAIVTVGKALTEKSLDDWKEALQQLRKSRLVDIYEDYNIEIEKLTRYAMGLEEYEDVNSLDEARSQVSVAINQLQDSSLLLKGNAKEYVKMHDMVRDVGLWIASKGENEFKLRACTHLEKNINFERVTTISLIGF